MIATAGYDDQLLRQLRAPARDAAELAEVLGDPRVGGFAVTSEIDQSEARIRRAITRFLHGRATGELVVVYISCHGLLDARGQLYFAAKDTDGKALAATAVESRWLTDRLDECRARQQVLILDCCFSGAFTRGSKGALDLAGALTGPGRGRILLTASRDGEYSFEGQSLTGQEITSVFTEGLIKGLATGEADADQDGLISVEDAHEYACAHLRERGSAQSPQRSLFAAEGTIILARNPAGTVIIAAPLPEHLTASLDSPSPHVRIGAVHALGALLTGADPALALAAREQLQSIADQDGPQVAAASRQHLGAVPPPGQPGGGPRTAPARDRRVPAPAAAPRVLVATASDDETARIWDTASGAALATLRGHQGGVWNTAFSPDGTLIATASLDHTARIWDTRTAAVLATLLGHEYPVRGVAFAPDGALIATASDDHTARIWEPASGAARVTLDGHHGPVLGVAFSPDGTLIATACADRTVRIWDTASGAARATLRGHQGGVWSVAFSPDGTLLATASQDKTARICDVADGTTCVTLRGHTGAVRGVAFSPRCLRAGAVPP